MNAIRTSRAVFAGDLLRYGRSWGLWLLLLIVPIGSRYLVEGSAVHIAVDGHLLVMSSATVGVTIGVVVSTLLLPVGFLYLRSNVTRRRAWQVEDVTPASRLAMVLGHFSADCLVLLAALCAATLAGWILTWRADEGPLDLLQTTRAAWLIACPSLVWVAALRQLMDAIPATRGAWGDVLAFVCWMMVLVMPATVGERPSSLAVNMHDLAGYTRPIIGDRALLGQDFAVGGGPVLPGRKNLDAEAGLGAAGYGASRVIWLALGLLAAVLAGLANRPVTPRRRREPLARFAAWRGRPRHHRPPANDIPAKPSSWPMIELISTEFRLIGRGWTFKGLAAAAALAGLFGDFRHLGSPAGLLVLVFAVSAHAGRSEAKGLLALTATTRTSPLTRRACFFIAGTAWALILAVPRAVLDGSSAPLLLGAATGAATALLAVSLAWPTKSAFTSRMVLLILWYAYFSS